MKLGWAVIFKARGPFLSRGLFYIFVSSTQEALNVSLDWDMKLLVMRFYSIDETKFMTLKVKSNYLSEIIFYNFLKKEALNIK